MDRAVEKEESWRERMRLRDIAKNEIADRTCRRAIHQTTKVVQSLLFCFVLFFRDYF